MTKIFNNPYWTPFHFQQQLNSSDRLFFSSYGHISVVDITNGITNNTFSHSTVVAGHKQHSGYIEGVGSAARFRKITGFDQNGTHIIAVDSGNHCIRTINIDSKETKALAGTCCLAGYSDGPATAALFNSPQSIIKIKEAGLNGYRYLIADKDNSAIRMLTSHEAKLETFIRDAENLNEPTDLAMDQHGANLYVTTASGLIQIKITTKEITTVESVNQKPYKISLFAANLFLISYENSGMLTVFNATNNSIEQKCQSTGEGCQLISDDSVAKCQISSPYSLYSAHWLNTGSKLNSTIIIGGVFSILTMSVKCEYSFIYSILIFEFTCLVKI